MNQEVPQRNTNSDKKNGMNSTLLVLITNLMMDRGEAYMMIEKMVAAKPQKSFLVFPWRANRETKATTAKMKSTSVKRPRILLFSFLGAYKMKINT